MRELFFHFSVIMSFLTLLIGLWTNYNYGTLIIKAVEVFFICMVGSAIVQYALKYVLPEPPPQEEPIHKKTKETTNNINKRTFETGSEPQKVNVENEANPAT